MIISLTYQGIHYRADLNQPCDISYPLVPGRQEPKCFWAPDVIATPVKAGDWIGSTAQGGTVNFYNVQLNPHGNGTHTECVGHIASKQYSVQDSLRKHHHMAHLITIEPETIDNGDRVISADQLKEALHNLQCEALIIRTLPNDIESKNKDYSGSNPTYIDAEGITYIIQTGAQHLLVDIPSVDREDDGGKLAAHKAWWDYPKSDHDKKTITELVYIDNALQDGIYLLEIQTIPLVLDATPSRPVLYQLTQE